MKTGIIKKITCSFLAAALLAVLTVFTAAASASLPFTDVSGDSWYAGYVESAWESGLIAGVSETSFAPDDELTVASAITLAARMNQLYSAGSVTLENGTDTWYSTYVDYAVRNGIISYGMFSASDMNRSITREEFAGIFYYALPSSEYPDINIVEADSIPDVGTSSFFAYEIYMFYRAGILTGSDEYGTFNPKSNILRSEASAVMARMFDPDLRQKITLVRNSPEFTESSQDGDTLSESEVYGRIIAMKDIYPEGTPLTNDFFYEWNGGIFSGGYGCAGFAFMLSDEAFGTNSARLYTDFDYTNLRVGDILRLNNDTHSVIILEVHDDYVVIAEGNYNGSVHWGRQLSRSDVMTADYMITRY